MVPLSPTKVRLSFRLAVVVPEAMCVSMRVRYKSVVPVPCYRARGERDARFYYLVPVQCVDHSIVQRVDVVARCCVLLQFYNSTMQSRQITRAR